MIIEEMKMSEDERKCITLDPVAQQRIMKKIEEEDQRKRDELGQTIPQEWLQHLKDLGESLHEIRMEKGITLRDFSIQAYFDVCYISDVERGLAIPTKELLDAYTKSGCEKVR